MKQALWNVFCKVTKIKKNRVLFVSFDGRAYSDNPKAVSCALHDMDPTAEILWVTKDLKAGAAIYPDYVKLIDRNKPLQYTRALTTSKVIVDNENFKIAKRKGQRFVQVWHGDRAFKKILYDSPFFKPTSKVREEEEGYCDLAVSGSEYGYNTFRSAFRYTGEMITTGTPRDDMLLRNDPQQAAEVKKKLGIPDGAKVLLYAPTLRRKNQRGKGDQEIQDLDVHKTLEALEKKYGCDWIFLLRAHPVMSGLTGFETGEKVKDVSKYEDMADLLLVSDLLITDYSSSAGDFALLGRPIILYQSDRAEYIEKDRTFYFEMEDSPYMIAENQAELEAFILQLTDEKARENCRAILDFYKTTENGCASKAVAERIMSWIRE